MALVVYSLSNFCSFRLLFFSFSFSIRLPWVILFDLAKVLNQLERKKYEAKQLWLKDDPTYFALLAYSGRSYIVGMVFVKGMSDQENCLDKSNANTPAVKCNKAVRSPETYTNDAIAAFDIYNINAILLHPPNF